MSQRTSDVRGDQPVQAKADHFNDGRGTPHVVWQDQPERPGETRAYIRSSVMYDLRNCL